MSNLRDFKADAVERGIIYLGGIQPIEFITASGDEANVKVELDVLNDSYLIRALARSALVDLAEPYNPDLLIPMPTGADAIGQEVSEQMDIECAFLKWGGESPEHKKLVHRTSEDLDKIRHAGRIILLCGEFRTGSTLRTALNRPNIGEKTAAALCIWDSSDGTESRNFPVPVESVVHRHIPTRVT